LGSILHNIANITQYYKFNITQYSKATKTRFFSSICVNIHQYYMPKSIFLNIHQYYLSNLQMTVTMTWIRNILRMMLTVARLVISI
jgi:hydroxymethylglutaryl-CoA reductase